MTETMEMMDGRYRAKRNDREDMVDEVAMGNRKEHQVGNAWFDRREKRKRQEARERKYT
jgi:hypothetical protein